MSKKLNIKKNKLKIIPKRRKRIPAIESKVDMVKFSNKKKIQKRKNLIKDSPISKKFHKLMKVELSDNNKILPLNIGIKSGSSRNLIQKNLTPISTNSPSPFQMRKKRKEKLLTKYVTAKMIK